MVGWHDGCALPFLADGQDADFIGPYTAETWEATGHFPHLEQPRRTAETLINWFGAHVARPAQDSPTHPQTLPASLQWVRSPEQRVSPAVELPIHGGPARRPRSTPSSTLHPARRPVGRSARHGR